MIDLLTDRTSQVGSPELCREGFSEDDLAALALSCTLLKGFSLSYHNYLTRSPVSASRRLGRRKQPARATKS